MSYLTGYAPKAKEKMTCGYCGSTIRKGSKYPNVSIRQGRSGASARQVRRLGEQSDRK